MKDIIKKILNLEGFKGSVVTCLLGIPYLVILIVFCSYIFRFLDYLHYTLEIPLIYFFISLIAVMWSIFFGFIIKHNLKKKFNKS